jgi:hypothetical protein
MILHDILDNKGQFLPINELNRNFNANCGVMEYNSLKDSIPRTWREKLKTEDVCKEMIPDDGAVFVELNKQNIQVNYVSNKEIYWKLIKQIQLPHVTKEKWEL